MNTKSRSFFLVAALTLLFAPWVRAGSVPSCVGATRDPKVGAEYFVSIANHDRHLLHVAIRYFGDDPVSFAMPEWNSLYQVRDFAQYVTELHATNARGESLSIAPVDKNTWQVAATDGCGVVEYDVFVNTSGPFSTQANAEHVFVNWAQVLLYAPKKREAPVMLTVTDVPPQWTLHDLTAFDENGAGGIYRLSRPIEYDRLVDSPVEMSSAESAEFTLDGAQYRVVIDADKSDYNRTVLQEAIAKVVHAEVDWMQDRPFDRYTIVYHFPHGPVGGGMEHSYGTAVTTPTNRLQEDPLAPISTTAHEFFHLWNVKRIRPQTMEPLDYEHEQPTKALWFCEGVTSTVAELMLVRAGLEDERGYLAHVSGVVSDFEAHPAKKFQSPEASSLDAWMEGHPYYRRPERSVSYYTSGEVLGVLLDLRLRALTHGTKSLRDLFQYMNAQYAKRGRFYDDSAGVQAAAEKVSGGSFSEFFDRYVHGTKSIPYDEFFAVVGLKLEPMSLASTDAGFDAGVNFTGLPEVVQVAPGSAVEAAGVRVGDTLSAIDDREYAGDLGSYLASHKAGEVLSFRFATRGATITVPVKLIASTVAAYSLVDLPTVSQEQRAQRAAWIVGDDMTARMH